MDICTREYKDKTTTYENEHMSPICQPIRRNFVAASRPLWPEI